MDLKIEDAKAEDLDSLEPLWNRLYEHQLAHGQLLPVPPGAFAAWRKSFEPVLGRFGLIVVARLEGQVVGFVAGRTRTLPSYFGGGLAGFISDVFTEEHARRGGVAKQLLERARHWFAAQGAVRMELQVIPGNITALNAYRKMGWQDELIQMTLPISAPRP